MCTHSADPRATCAVAREPSVVRRHPETDYVMRSRVLACIRTTCLHPMSVTHGPLEFCFSTEEIHGMQAKHKSTLRHLVGLIPSPWREI